MKISGNQNSPLLRRIPLIIAVLILLLGGMSIALAQFGSIVPGMGRIEKMTKTIESEVGVGELEVGRQSLGGSADDQPDEESNDLGQENDRADIEEEIVLAQGVATPPSPANASVTEESYQVVAVIDGDTIEVTLKGRNERVRMIGIDTPEIVDPRKPVECFGQEASTKAKELLLGTAIRLDPDPTQGDRDKYGRLLRYAVLEDGRSYQQEMLRDGYAYEYTYMIPYQQQTEFKALQQQARTAEQGLWAKLTCRGQRTKPTPQGESTCIIKGNISEAKDKIYHLPGGSYYDSTVIDETIGERWFCSESEAIEAGWRKSKV